MSLQSNFKLMIILFFIEKTKMIIFRSSRYDAGEVPVYPIPVPDIFTHVDRPSGQSSEFWLSEKDYNCAHAYVLRNCDYFRP